MAQIYKPDISEIRKQSAQAREADEERKKKGFSDDNKFRWGDIELRDKNVFRLLPPTNSRGIIFKRVCTHYFNNSPFSASLKKMICTVQSFQDSLLGVPAQ